MVTKKLLECYLLIIGLLVLLAGCQTEKNQKMSSQAEQKTAADIAENEQWDISLYRKYEAALINNDAERENCPILGEDGWEIAENYYREGIEESFYGMLGTNGNAKGQCMEGLLVADGDDNSLRGLRIAVRDEYGWIEYFYYNSGDIIYFSFEDYGERGGNLPEYVMCEGVLNHYRLNTSVEENDIWEENKKVLLKEEQGIFREFIVSDGRIYEINRGKKMILDVTDTTVKYMGEWLECEAVSCLYSMKITEEALENISNMLPENYQLTENVAVCDLNGDGMEDYLAVVFQAYEMEEAKYYGYKYMNGSVELWAYFSDNKNQTYEREVLVERGLWCYNLKFIEQDLLMVENEYGYDSASPWRTDYFLFNHETDEFEFYKAYQIKGGTVLVKGREAVGKIALTQYYSSDVFRNIEGWALEEDCNLEGNGQSNITIKNTIVYENIDEKKEEIFKEIISDAECSYAMDEAKSEDTGIQVQAKYQNSKIFCGEISGGEYIAAIQIDLKNGEMMDLTKLITKEEMLDICQRGMRDMYRNDLEESLKEEYLEYIENGYEMADSLTPHNDLKEGGAHVNFQVTFWGVRVLCKTRDGDYESFMVDKEYFMDTSLWNYLKPDLKSED